VVTVNFLKSFIFLDSMSDTTTALPSPGGTPKISSINEVVIRIAGNSQDGIQAIGGFLA